jgi:hypothetical protein
MPFRDRELGITKTFPDGSIRVEIDLPVVVGMAVRPNSEHRAGKIKLEDLDIRRRSRGYVRNSGDTLF